MTEQGGISSQDGVERKESEGRVKASAAGVGSLQTAQPSSDGRPEPFHSFADQLHPAVSLPAASAPWIRRERLPGTRPMGNSACSPRLHDSCRVSGKNIDQRDPGRGAPSPVPLYMCRRGLPEERGGSVRDLRGTGKGLLPKISPLSICHCASNSTVRHLESSAHPRMPTKNNVL